MSDELGIEGGEVLDHGVYNSFDNVALNKLLENFTITYSRYAGEGKDLYFVFGNRNLVSVATYTEIATGSISVDFGGSKTVIDISKNQYKREDVSGAVSDTVRVDIEGIEYDFNLREGENFYFVISQEIEGERFIGSNK